LGECITNSSGHPDPEPNLTGPNGATVLTGPLKSLSKKNKNVSRHEITTSLTIVCTTFTFCLFELALLVLKSAKNILSQQNSLGTEDRGFESCKNVV
jgi:hypothetical protein